MTSKGYTFSIPKNEGPLPELPEGHTRVSTLNADGSWTHSSFDMGDDLRARLALIREEDKKLKEAGTPYWCIHDRSVTHPRAEWKEDGYTRPDGIEMQYKHGVICLDCLGYIQEG